MWRLPREAMEHIDGLAKASLPSLRCLASLLGLSTAGHRPVIAERIIVHLMVGEDCGG